MKKLFITGPRHIVSAFLMRQIEKGYEVEQIKDDDTGAMLMLAKADDNDK